MSTKRKTTAKKTTKQVKAQLAAKFDDALELPASKTVVAVEPMEVTAEDALDETAGEAWPNYSPFPEEETEGPGFSPANLEPSTTDVDAVVESWDDVTTDGPNKPVPMDAPSLGSGEPVEASDPLSGTECHNIPESALQAAGDVIKNLIEGMNYLYKISKNVKGLRGLKTHDETILRERVRKGRELINQLAGLK
jgi:hypothetical protein